MPKRQYNDFNNGDDNQNNNLNNKPRVERDEEIEVTYAGELNQRAADFKAKKSEEGRVEEPSRNSIDLSSINSEENYQITEKFTNQIDDTCVSLCPSKTTALVYNPKSYKKNSANPPKAVNEHNYNRAEDKSLSKKAERQVSKEKKNEQYKKDGLAKIEIHYNKVELNDVLLREFSNIKDIIINKFNDNSELNALFLANMTLSHGSLNVLKDILVFTPNLKSLTLNKVKIVEPIKQYNESYLIKNSYLNQFAAYNVNLSQLVRENIIKDLKNNKFINCLKNPKIFKNYKFTFIFSKI